MTVATASAPSPTDRLVTLQGDWAHFKLIQQGCEQSSGVRLAYFDGEIEILMPGQLHEIFADVIGWMLNYFLMANQVDFFPTGSVTQEKEGEAAAEADKSYCIGEKKPIPDLSIEVVFTSGGLAKLLRYQALKVTEVWFWNDGTLELYKLSDRGYQRIQQSQLPKLDALDLALLERCILMAETDPP
ncbi:MAG: Uma2 family endonuclease, partial [Cyanobacteria bacterium J06626_23]